MNRPERTPVPTKIIFDTDIGTDVDDILALSLVLASPELELIGVTTAYGDTRLRAKLTHRVLELVGRDNIPVAAGDTQTLERNRAIWMPGHEGRIARADQISDTVIARNNAVDFMLETIRAHPGEVVICAIAPLVNLAQANKKPRGKPRSIQCTSLPKQRCLQPIHTPIQPPILAPALPTHIRPDHPFTPMRSHRRHEIPLGP
jgi:inosine-uridine nucleoside N-ribohydrolase